MNDETNTPDDDDAALAAEYVLGVLPATQVKDFARRLANEPQLRQLCEDWDDHFAALAVDIAPVSPPTGVWRGVNARLFGPKPPFWRRLGLGQALIGGVFASLLAFAVVQQGWLDPDKGAPFTAVLSSEGNVQVALIALDPTSGRLTAELTDQFPDTGRSRELWLILNGNSPVSLGLLAPEQVVSLSLPTALRIELTGAVLAISDEPAGGSPTGAPTGAVLATGTVTAA